LLCEQHFKLQTHVPLVHLHTVAQGIQPTLQLIIILLQCSHFRDLPRQQISTQHLFHFPLFS